MNIYYVYEYRREDKTPYYIGKGKNNRAYSSDHTVKLPPKERIRFIAENLYEKEALDLEKKLIAKYGRKDLGTGILRNLTSGRQGSSPGPETKAKLSKAAKGKKPNNYGKSYKLKGPRKWNRQGKNHHMYGIHHTDEARQKISKGIKENWDRPILTCPHCGKQGKQNMTRWHFDNCKQLQP